MRTVWIRRAGIYMLLISLLVGGKPLPVAAFSMAGQVPSPNAPQVHLPEAPVTPNIEQPQINEPNSTPHKLEPALQKRPLQVKEAISKAIKMTLGSHNLVYQTAQKMNDSGQISGGNWSKFARQYVYQMAAPWLGLLPVKGTDPYLDGMAIVGKLKETPKFYETYQLIRTWTAAEATAGIVHRFSLFGGLTGMAFGALQTFDSLQTNNGIPESQQTASFYSGLGDMMSGFGTVLGAVAMSLAGSTLAPILIVTGSTLFFTGVLLSSLAFAFKYSPRFRQSRLGRNLTALRQTILNWF